MRQKEINNGEKFTIDVFLYTVFLPRAARLVNSRSLSMSAASQSDFTRKERASSVFYTRA